MSIHTVTTVRELRQFVRVSRHQGKSVGLVPTMGALHAGHASLIRRAAAECGVVVVSVFVNPTQFRPEEDYTRYPRNLASDESLSGRSGAHLVFAPSVDEMYGTASFAAGEPARSTYVEVPGLSDVLEGASRPGHFRGVATVVLKLLLQALPDRAYFGQKDAQQLAVIRKMVSDLNVPADIVACETLREEDGLAMSSRNVYLTPEQRANAPVLYRALTEARERVDEGECDAGLLRVVMAEMIDRTPGCTLDYAVIVDPTTFVPRDRIGDRAIALVAARFGATRLIDNMILTTRPSLA